MAIPELFDKTSHILSCGQCFYFGDKCNLPQNISLKVITIIGMKGVWNISPRREIPGSLRPDKEVCEFRASIGFTRSNFTKSELLFRIVDDERLSCKIKSLLRRNNITTLRDLVHFPSYNILMLNGMGSAGYKELVDYVNTYFGERL